MEELIYEGLCQADKGPGCTLVEGKTDLFIFSVGGRQSDVLGV